MAASEFYPLYLKLSGKRCLVVGGGKVAYRKIQGLLRRGALVTCVSREFSEPVRNLARKQKDRLRLAPHPTPLPEGEGETLFTLPSPPRGERVRVRGLPSSFFDGAHLVIVATSDRRFNMKVAERARKKKILVNVADDPELCDFYAPAVVERGPLQIAISTGGASPLFARRLREALEKVIPPSIGKLLTKIGRIRDLKRGAWHHV